MPQAGCAPASTTSRLPPVANPVRTSRLDCDTEWIDGVAVRDVRRLPLGENRSVPILVGDAGAIAHHMLDGEVFLERVVAHVLAETGCTETAVRHLADDRDVIVDPHAAGVDLARRALGAVHVARPCRRG